MLAARTTRAVERRIPFRSHRRLLLSLLLTPPAVSRARMGGGAHRQTPFSATSPPSTAASSTQESLIPQIEVAESLDFPACVILCLNYLESVHTATGLVMRKKVWYRPYGNFIVRIKELAPHENGFRIARFPSMHHVMHKLFGSSVLCWVGDEEANAVSSIRQLHCEKRLMELEKRRRELNEIFGLEGFKGE